METMIKVEGVSKKFRMYSDKPLTLKERIVKGEKGSYTDFYALKEVSFEVKKGSTVALIGQNGCGKSTLLKMINRTMYPDVGKIGIKGKVASLIELGAGFHPELSGRENIYNNATIFGFTKSEIEKRIPSIIEFSELEDFIDNPIRTYSSGMYARLGFSVAIHVDADILLVDEILGVGDINFQSKCANKIYEMRKKGTTILLVTHDMSTVDKLCDYAIWLDHGKKLAEGDPQTMQRKYVQFMAERQEDRKKTVEKKEIIDEELLDDSEMNKLTDLETKKDCVYEKRKSRVSITSMGEHYGNGDVIITGVKILNKNGSDKRSFYTGEDIRIRVEYLCQVNPNEVSPNIGFEIFNQNGVHVYGSNTMREKHKNINIKPHGVIEIVLHKIMLLQGEYTVGIAISEENESSHYDYYHSLAVLKIYNLDYDIGISRIHHSFAVDDCLL